MFTSSNILFLFFVVVMFFWLIMHFTNKAIKID